MNVGSCSMQGYEGAGVEEESDQHTPQTSFVILFSGLGKEKGIGH